MDTDDKRLNKLITVLEKLPGLKVMSSSHGRDDYSKLWREQYKQNIPYDYIRVHLSPPQYEINREAYASIEWMAWVVYKMGLHGSAVSPDLEFRPFAVTPYLNGVGESLAFIFEGVVQNPDELADEIDKAYQQYFHPPEI